VPARIDRIPLLALACLLPCLLPCLAGAQVPPWPTAQDIDRALKANPFPDADRIGSQAIPQPPRVEPQRSAIDIEALARGKVQLPNAGGTSGAATVPLRIFITLDMPRASLQLLTDQAARAGAVLVLRGLKSQSMRQTVAVVQELIGKRRVAWVIDPEAFTRFAVRQAPTFVLMLNDAASDAQRGCNAGCATPASFVSVAGDVSLDYALETIQRRQPQAAPRAKPFLKQLRGS
jgi:conjugal transfer pilus assembly protein TrbC